MEQALRLTILARARGGNFQSQDGIADNVPGSSNNGNILLLKLSDISAGSTLSLLLQAGVTGDSFTIYTFEDSGAAPTSLTKYVQTINVDENVLTIAARAPSPSDGADNRRSHHYQAQAPGGSPFRPIATTCCSIPDVTPAAAPEPRFYGLLLAGLLGLAGMVYQKRRAAQANA